MIRIRAFGTYAMRIADPKEFFKTIVGTQGLTTTDDILGQLRSTIIAASPTSLAESKIAALDLASSYRRALAARAEEARSPSSQRTASSCRASSSTTSRCRKKSRPRSISARSSASSATGSASTRRCRPRSRSRSPPRIPAASPAPASASAQAWPSADAMGGAFNAPRRRRPARPRLRRLRGGAANAPRWSLAIDGKTYGPYTDDALKAMVQSGQVARRRRRRGVRARAAGRRSIRTRSSGSAAAARCRLRPPPPSDG